MGAELDGEKLFADPVLGALASGAPLGFLATDPPPGAVTDPPSGAVATALPLDIRSCVLGGGEDYELLCAVADVNAVVFRELAADVGVEVRAVGSTVVSQQGVTVTHEGRREPLEQSGWDHFA